AGLAEAAVLAGAAAEVLGLAAAVLAAGDDAGAAVDEVAAEPPQAASERAEATTRAMDIRYFMLRTILSVSGYARSLPPRRARYNRRCKPCQSLTPIRISTSRKRPGPRSKARLTPSTSRPR